MMATVIVGLSATEVVGQSTANVPAGYFNALRYRHVGPVGNRVSAVVGIPGDVQTYFIGAASGGVWRTQDAGLHWEPLFDDQEAQSIGAIAVAPSDHNVIWVGTGESFIRSNVSIGNGVYRSTDGGETWEHLGLESSGRIGRIVVDPRDPDVAWVAAVGHLYGPQEERGVYKTQDGGATWDRVLFVDQNTGAIDLAMHPENPRILYAAMWEMEIWTWGRESGGPGSGLYMSQDGGGTWRRLEGNGLPTGILGKIGLAVSPDHPERIYALIETNSNPEFGPVEPFEGVLWRSDDRAGSWEMVNATNAMTQRPLYYTRAAVAPDDADEIHFMATAHTISYDGGRNLVRGTAGGDNHDMWIDPELPDRMIVGHDQGVSISTNRGESWFRPLLPIAQMYHVYTDNRVPYNVLGNRQDGNSQMGPSNSLTRGRIPIGAWHSVGGCESGFSIADTVSNNVIWSGCYDGILDRYDLTTGLARTVSVWPDNPEGWAAEDLRYRFQWTFPIALSPHDPERVYVGSQYVHVTTNGGQTWSELSPDLTTNDKSLQKKTGGLTPDDSSPTYAAVLFSIAESPVQEGQIWAGSNDGLLHVTTDGGDSWSLVSDNIPDLPELGTFSNVEPSRYDPHTAYVTVDRHQLGDTNPYIYRTRDLGASWQRIVGGIPVNTFSYVHVIREDPHRQGLLYAGTENGIYVSLDDGDSWASLQSNLPRAPVHWLTVQPHFNDLVVATYGRGFWILDDVTPLQLLTDETLSTASHLYAPRPAYRFHFREAIQAAGDDPASGTNPEYGASIHFAIGEGVSGPASLTILDAAGEVARRIYGTDEVKPGLHRVHWDLRYTASTTPRLRVAPPGRPGIGVDPETGFRGLSEGGRVRPLAPPGTYTVRLEVGDFIQEVPLQVLKDPNSGGSVAGATAQFEAQVHLRDMANRTVALIDELEWARKGALDAVQQLQEGDAGEGRGELSQAAQALETRMADLETLLFDLRLSGGLSGQDTLRWPRRLYAKIASLAGYVSGTDDPPTDQSLEVLEVYQRLLVEYETEMQAIRVGPMAELNRRLAAAGVRPIT